MEIKIYQKDQLENNKEVLASAIESFDYGNHDYCIKIVEGSHVIALVSEEAEVVGFGRIVGDGVRFSYIVDLNIAESCRRKGYGTKLVQELAKSVKTTYIETTNDPNFQWLKDFYLKAGFKLSEGEDVFEWSK